MFHTHSLCCVISSCAENPEQARGVPAHACMQSCCRAKITSASQSSSPSCPHSLLENGWLEPPPPCRTVTFSTGPYILPYCRENSHAARAPESLRAPRRLGTPPSLQLWSQTRDLCFVRTPQCHTSSSGATCMYVEHGRSTSPARGCRIGGARAYNVHAWRAAARCPDCA